MKMEFLDNTGNGKYAHVSPRSLVRISDFTESERLQLMKSIQETLLDRNEIVKLHELPFIQSINCSVTLQLAAEDECLVTSGGQSEYACLLTQSAFKDMIELIKFSSGGHNWLTPVSI